MILICVTFLAGVLYYIFSQENRSEAFVAFFYGCILGIVILLSLILLSLDDLENSASVWIESARIYLIYYLIPVVIALPLFLLFSFSLSETTLFLVPAMLMGLFTISFIGAIYSHRTEPENFKAEILLISMFSAIFLYETILKIFFSVMSFFPSLLTFLLGTLLFLLICYPIAIILGSYHFTNARLFTFIIAIAVLAISIIPQRLISMFK